MSLVGFNINDEDKRVIFLDFLHGAFSVQGVDDDFVVVEAGFMRNGLARVLGRPRELEGFWPVEGC